MCDEHTFEAETRSVARGGLSRRELGVLGLTMVMSGTVAGQSAQADSPALVETMVSIPTPDGKADAFFVYPSKGKHPAVILWPDIAGLRDSYKQLGRALAGAGYAVLVVNQYYRSAPAPVLATFATWRTAEGREKLAPMIARITSDGIMRDAKAFVAFLDRQRQVDRSRHIGTTGYCMGGPFAVRTASAVPGRIGAAASFHGAALVTDKADSPHRLLQGTKASFLFAIARNDDARSPDDKALLRAAAKESQRPAEIEVYQADHGWCTPDSPVFDAVEARRAWTRMLALFATL